MEIILVDAISRFIDHCRVVKRLSANTLRAYKADLDDFSSFVGKEAVVGAADRESLRHYARKLFDDDELKETSVKRRMASLKVMFRWLEIDELISLSPFHRLDISIRLPRKLPRALTVDEIRRLILACENLGDSHNGTMLRFVVICLFSTGLRVGELTGIEQMDVDLSGHSILVRGKGNRERRVFLPSGEAVASLKRYMKKRQRYAVSSNQLLITPDGENITTQYVRRHLARFAKDAGIDRRVTPHMLRHTAATQLIEAGVDIRFVQKLLGHASIATTQIYTQVSDISLKETLERANTLKRVRDGVSRRSSSKKSE